jgi:hypothetical protein
METLLYVERFQVERKAVTVQLSENHQGRLVRIIEESAGRKNVIVIPSSGLEMLAKLIDNCSKKNATLVAVPAAAPATYLEERED